MKVLPIDPTLRRQVLNAQARLRALDAKGWLSTTDLQARANAQRIVRKYLG